MRIDVMIDTLAVQGLDVGDPAAFEAAVRAELSRLLAERGAPPAWRQPAAHPAIAAGTVAMDGRPARLGQQVAQAVYGSLEQGETRELKSNPGRGVESTAAIRSSGRTNRRAADRA